MDGRRREQDTEGGKADDGGDGGTVEVGVCLMCEQEIAVDDPATLEDDFFAHFAEVHRSGEPMYTVTRGGRHGR